jgi:hypothetical protein
MRVDRQDSLVVLAPPAAQLKVQTLLDDLRKALRRSEVAVHFSLLAMPAEAADEIMKSGKTLAATAEEKAALLKPAQMRLSELRFLAADGQRSEVAQSYKTEAQGNSPATETTASGWVIPTVTKDGAVVINFETVFAKETGRAGENAPPLKSELRVRTTVQLPDGAMMLVSCAALDDAGTQVKCLLVEVRVIPPPKAK